MEKKKFIVLCTLCFVAVGTNAFAAAGDYVIYTWGYGDIMKNMLEAVKLVLGTEDYRMALKLAMLLSIIVTFLSVVSDKGFNSYLLIQRIAMVVLIQVLISSNPHNAFIFDETRNGASNTPAYTVQNVPAVIGLPLYLISNIERGMANAFRKSLAATPGAITMGNLNGTVVPITAALNMLQSASSFRINDPAFMRSMHSYVENCVVPDILSGHIDIYTVGTSDDFWGALQAAQHGVRLGNNYMAPEAQENGIDGKIETCTQLYNSLNTKITDYTGVGGKAWQQITGAMGLAADADVNGLIGGIAQSTFKYQHDGSALLKSAIAINGFNDSYAMIASQAGVDASALSYGMAKSQEVARMNNAISGIMAKKYLPIAKGYLTVIFIAIIPIIFIIALATGNFKKPVAMIAGLLTALGLWTVGDQLLDFIILIRTSSLFTGFGGVYNLQTQPIIDTGVVDSLSLSLGMYWMIPTLSFAVASLSGYAASSMMSGIGSKVLGGVGAAASEAASGSRSMGIIREDMINMNKYDATNSMSGGLNSQMLMNHKGEGVDVTNQSALHSYSDKQLREIAKEDGNFEVKGNKWSADYKDQYGNAVHEEGNINAQTGGYDSTMKQTTYNNPEGVDLGNGIHLGKGATSTQYADGRIEYKGVDEKLGAVTATFGGVTTDENGKQVFTGGSHIKADSGFEITEKDGVRTTTGHDDAGYSYMKKETLGKDGWVTASETRKYDKEATVGGVKVNEGATMELSGDGKHMKLTQNNPEGVSETALYQKGNDGNYQLASRVGDKGSVENHNNNVVNDTDIDKNGNIVKQTTVAGQLQTKDITVGDDGKKSMFIGDDKWLAGTQIHQIGNKLREVEGTTSDSYHAKATYIMNDNGDWERVKMNKEQGISSKTVNKEDITANNAMLYSDKVGAEKIGAVSIKTTGSEQNTMDEAQFVRTNQNGEQETVTLTGQNAVLYKGSLGAAIENETDSAKKAAMQEALDKEQPFIDMDKISTIKTERGDETIIKQNVNQHNAGATITGDRGGHAIVDKGVLNSSYDIENKNSRDVLVDHLASETNKVAKLTGSDKVSEAQQAAVVGSLKASAELFGFGAGVAASIGANLQHSSDASTIADINRVAYNSIFDQLKADRAAGKFNNPDGTLNKALYDDTARSQVAAWDNFVEKEASKHFGHGRATQDALNKVEQVTGNVAEKVDSAIDKISNADARGVAVAVGQKVATDAGNALNEQLENSGHAKEGF